MLYYMLYYTIANSFQTWVLHLQFILFKNAHVNFHCSFRKMRISLLKRQEKIFKSALSKYVYASRPILAEQSSEEIECRRRHPWLTANTKGEKDRAKGKKDGPCAEAACLRTLVSYRSLNFADSPKLVSRCDCSPDISRYHIPLIFKLIS